MKIPYARFMVAAIFWFTGCSTSTVAVNGQSIPSWVKNRPVSQTSYIGIGIAQKSGASRDYIQIAKDNALNDLASQITVSIRSNVIRQVVEKAGIIEDDFQSYIRSSTKADLEGYELVDTWESNQEYWVFYRLSKAVYEEQKRIKLKKAMSLSLDLFSSARTNENDHQIDKALLFYLQSLNPIEKYINEPLETQIDGRDVFLMNEIYSSLQRLLSAIELRSVDAKLSAKIGKPLRKPVEVSAVYMAANNQEVQISNLPLQFQFIRGNGDLIERARTDRFGRGRSQVSKITALDRIQIINAKVDLNTLISNDSVSVIRRSIINSLPIPATKFTIDVSGLSAVIRSEEFHFGQKTTVLHIEPSVKDYLAKNGFVFINNPSKADVMFTIRAESRQGSEIYGMYSAFVNLTVSVVDLSSGDEIYKGSLQDVKGIDLTFNKAGLKALDNAAKQVNTDLMPKMIRHIQQ